LVEAQSGFCGLLSAAPSRRKTQQQPCQEG
jgi:hypothetical protein